MIINPDKFRSRVGIYTRQQTPNAQGNINYANDLIKTVWAFINPEKGSTYLYDQQINEVTTTIIMVRYLNWLTTENWIRHTIQTFRTNASTTNQPLLTSKLYRILKIKNIESWDRFLELECEEYNQI